MGVWLQSLMDTMQSVLREGGGTISSEDFARALAPLSTAAQSRKEPCGLWVFPPFIMPGLPCLHIVSTSDLRVVGLHFFSKDCNRRSWRSGSISCTERSMFISIPSHRRRELGYGWLRSGCGMRQFFSETAGRCPENFMELLDLQDRWVWSPRVFKF